MPETKKKKKKSFACACGCSCDKANCLHFVKEQAWQRQVRAQAEGIADHVASNVQLGTGEAYIYLLLQ